MIYGNKTLQYAVYDRTSGRAQFVEDTTTVARPNVELLTDTIKGAGILGEIDLPAFGQIGSMVYEVTLRRTNPRAAALSSPGMHELEVRWVTDVVDSATGKAGTCANKDIIKGIYKKTDGGSLENNTAQETTLGFEVLYFKHIQDGKTVTEIDKLNNVFSVGGVDYLAGIRAGL